MLRIMSAGHSSRGDAASRVAEEGQRGNFPFPLTWYSPKVTWPWWGFLSFFLSFFFFDEVFLTNQRYVGHSPGGHNESDTAEQLNSKNHPIPLSVSRTHLGKRNTLCTHFHVGHETQISEAKKSAQKGRKANDIEANIPTEQSRACRRIVARGRPTSGAGPQGGNKNT